jgi:hypothetical protein
MGGLEMSLREVQNILKSVEKIMDKLQKLKGIEPKSKELFVRAPENIVSFSVAFDINRAALFSKKIGFTIPHIQRISLYSLVPYCPLEALQTADDSFTLDLENIPKETKNVLLNVEYKVPGSQFIADLIQTNVATETSSDQDAYWMHAAIRHPSYLEKLYKKLEIRDVDFNVDVGIYQEMKTAVPTGVLRALSILSDIAYQTDRNKAVKLLLQYMGARRGSRDPFQIIAQAANLFSPPGFKKFVDVTPPFRYYDAIIGRAFYENNIQILPKTVKVVARTDLDLNHPAADGTLYYRKNLLLRDLSDMFS